MTHLFFRQGRQRFSAMLDSITISSDQSHIVVCHCWLFCKNLSVLRHFSFCVRAWGAKATATIMRAAWCLPWFILLFHMGIAQDQATRYHLVQIDSRCECICLGCLTFTSIKIVDMTTSERHPNWCFFSKQTFQCNNYLANIEIQAMKSCLRDLCAWIFKMLRRALLKGLCAILWACLRGWIQLKKILGTWCILVWLVVVAFEES